MTNNNSSGTTGPKYSAMTMMTIMTLTMTNHMAELENNLNDNFEHIRTYDYGALYRLDHDFPPITIAEFKNTLRTFKQKAPGPTKITTLQHHNHPTTTQHDPT